MVVLGTLGDRFPGNCRAASTVQYKTHTNAEFIKLCPQFINIHYNYEYYYCLHMLFSIATLNVLILVQRYKWLKCYLYLCIFWLTSLISFQDLLQHFKGVGLSRCYTGLFILLDHLVNLRILVKSVHGKIRGRTGAAKEKFQYIF